MPIDNLCSSAKHKQLSCYKMAEPHTGSGYSVYCIDVDSVLCKGQESILSGVCQSHASGATGKADEQSLCQKQEVCRCGSQSLRSSEIILYAVMDRNII